MIWRIITDASTMPTIADGLPAVKGALLVGSMVTLAMMAVRLRARLYDLARQLSATPLYLDQISQQMKRDPQLSSGLVSHRGFHYPSDSLQRPLENTLAAYERSWSAGVKYCECDIAQTKDGEIILCHDANLKRLALDPNAELAVKDVTLCEFTRGLEFLSLKDGSRVPTLTEVLSAAKRVGNGSKLVIEIKGEDAPCAAAVAKLVGDDWGNYVALAMGFSLVSVREFARQNPRKGEVLSMLLTVRRKDARGYHYFDLDVMDDSIEVVRQNGVDGLYLQYDPAFLDDARFETLCKQLPIGVWGRAISDPDYYGVAKRLLSKGAIFVNTDFPDNFFAK